MREKRRFPRVGPVLVHTSVRYDETTGYAYLTSLSQGGAYLVTKERLEVDQTLSLRATLPWQLGQIEAQARVVYVISEDTERPEGFPTGAGLEFAGLGEEDLLKVRSYVSKFRELAAHL